MLGAPASTTFGQTGGGSMSTPSTTRGGYQQQNTPSTPATTNGIPQRVYDTGLSPRAGALLGPTLADVDPNLKAAQDNARAWTNFYDQLTAPQRAWLEKQGADFAARQGQISAKYAQVSGAARQGYDADMRLLDNQEAQNKIDMGAAARQPGLIDALFGITGYKYVNNRDLIEKQKGFTARTKTLADQGAELDYARQTRAANEDAAGRGAVGSEGFGATMNEYGQQRSQALDRSQLGYDSSMADLTNRGIQLDLDQEAAKLNYNEDKAKAQDRIKTLDLVADSFGIKRDQLLAALNRGLAENGLSEFMSANQVADMLNSNQRDQILLAESVVRQAISGQTSGLTPSALYMK